MLEFNKDHIYTLHGFIDIGALISLLGSGAIVISNLSTGNFIGKGKIWNRFIFFMSFCDMCGSFDLLIRQKLLEEKNEGCRIQGLTIQFFFISSILWTTAIAFSIYIVTVLKKEIKDMERFEYVFHIIIWSISLLLTIPLYLLDNMDQMKIKNQFVMGDATLWCWITDSYGNYRLLFFFAPLWLVFFFNAFVYFSMEIICKKKNKDLKEIYAKYDIAQKYKFYLLIMFITWIWGTINRIQNLISNEKIFILYLLHAIFTPLHGFLNSVVYFWYSVIQHFLRVKREIQQEENQRKSSRHHHSRNSQLEEGKPIKIVRKRSDRDLFDNYFVYKPASSTSSHHSRDKSKNCIKNDECNIKENNNKIIKISSSNSQNSQNNKMKALERHKTNATQYSVNSTTQMLKREEK